MHPRAVGWGAIALDVITADPNPTEYCRFVSIVLQVWKLEFVVNSVVSSGSCRCRATSGVKFHVECWISGSISLIHKRKSRMQSDRFALPFRDEGAVSVRVVNLVLDADFEVFDTVLLEGSYIAVSVLGARASWQALQLSLVLRNEIDEMRSLVLRCDVDRHSDIFTGLPIAALIIAPKPWACIGKACVTIRGISVRRGSKTIAFIRCRALVISGVSAPVLDFVESGAVVVGYTSHTLKIVHSAISARDALDSLRIIWLAGRLSTPVWSDTN
jgi:hypothetical protein